MAETTAVGAAPARIALDSAWLEAFCRRHHVRRLGLFGSVLRDDFRPESDVDVLVEFEPGHAPGFFGLAAMEAELSEKLGRRADLRAPGDLSPYFREQVIAAADVLYAA